MSSFRRVGMLAEISPHAADHATGLTAGFLGLILSDRLLRGFGHRTMKSFQALFGVLSAIHHRIARNDFGISSRSVIGELLNHLAFVNLTHLSLADQSD